MRRGRSGAAVGACGTLHLPLHPPKTASGAGGISFALWLDLGSLLWGKNVVPAGLVCTAKNPPLSLPPRDFQFPKILLFFHAASVNFPIGGMSELIGVLVSWSNPYTGNQTAGAEAR